MAVVDMTHKTDDTSDRQNDVCEDGDTVNKTDNQGQKPLTFCTWLTASLMTYFGLYLRYLMGLCNGKMKKRLNSSRLWALKRCQFHSKSFVAFHTGWKTCKKRPLHKSLWCYQVSFWSGKLICSLKKWVNEVPKQFPITNLQSNKTTVIWHYR